MNRQLHQDQRVIHYLLEKTRQVAARHFDRQESLPPGRFVQNLPPASLPDAGMGTEAVLALFEQQYATSVANTAGPRYFGFVTGGSTPAAVAGDWLVSTYDQNATGTNDSIAPHLEKQTIGFLKQLLGLDDAYYGSFVTGATMSNFVGLAVARQWVGEQRGVDFSQEGLAGHAPLKIISATPHASIFKALSMLGIGRQSITLVETQADREAVDLGALERHLKESGEPVIVVANAGTVNTVDFDDLEAIGRLKEKYTFWLHVDAAFGGFAACSPAYSHLMNGINHADSITVDAHKWLNVPYDAAMQFTRHRSLQGRVFQNQAAYLGGGISPDYLHHTPENSRRFRALPAWFTLMAYGRNGYREIIERNCALARRFGEHIRTSDNFRLLAPVRMNVACFTPRQEGLTMAEIQEFLDHVRDDGRAFFSPTVYRGVPAIRAAVSNWQTVEKDVDLAFEALESVFRHFVGNLSTTGPVAKY